MSQIKTTFRTLKSNKFFLLDKKCINDETLSLEAKGLLAYLLSKPDNFHHNETDIGNHCTNGRDSIRKCIAELSNCGYLVKFKQRDCKGQFTNNIWFILEDTSLKSEIPAFELNLQFIGNLREHTLPETDNVDNPSPDIPSTDIPATENPLPDIPQTDFPPVNNTNQTIERNEQESPHQEAQLPSWVEDLRFYLRKLKIDFDDDFSLVDLDDLEKRFSYFRSNLKEIRSPSSYLKTLMGSIIYKSPNEVLTQQQEYEARTNDLKRKMDINSFQFIDIAEMQYYMEKFKDLDQSFALFFKTPKSLSERALFHLKQLALDDNSYRSGQQLSAL